MKRILAGLVLSGVMLLAFPLFAGANILTPDDVEANYRAAIRALATEANPSPGHLQVLLDQKAKASKCIVLLYEEANNEVERQAAVRIIARMFLERIDAPHDRKNTYQKNTSNDDRNHHEFVCDLLER